MCPTGNSTCLVTVIVPVYNAGHLLLETLESVRNQTLDNDEYEVIVIDDGSTDKETIGILDDLEKGHTPSEIPLKVIRHGRNRYVAQARNTGVKYAMGKYICCLDSDDLISRDYLKKCVLILEADPRIGWVYPSVRSFGCLNHIDEAPDFEARAIFKSNPCVVSSVCRREIWIQTGGQRARSVVEGLHWFEDWDFWIRAMARGWFGVPLREPLFLYRRRVNSNMTRSATLKWVSTYLVLRANLGNYFRISKAQRRYDRMVREGRFGKYWPLSATRLLNRLSGRLLRSQIGMNVSHFPARLLCSAMFRPDRFVRSVCKNGSITTKAERLVGFEEKPNLDFRSSKKGLKNTILFAHYWWHMGGAENVLLDWLKAGRELAGVNIVDFVSDVSKQGYAELEDAFSRHSDEQYALSRMTSVPRLGLKIAWNLIARERPRVVFIMSNPHFYVLAPFVKRELPEVRIVDLLHCEDDADPAWFGTSLDYKTHIDKRIVTTEYWKNVLIEKYGETPDRVSVARNAIDVERFSQGRFSKTALRERFGISRDKFIVGFLGRLEYQKNPYTFLELADHMKSDTEYEFVVVGSGAFEDEVMKRIASLPNTKHFGATQEHEFFYAMFDLVVFPSVYEGYPLVGMETAAMERPIIATNIPGFREQIERGGFGLLYDQESPRADAKKIRDLIIKNRDRFPEMARKGRRFVLEHHDFRKRKVEYARILGDLMRQGGFPS